MVDTGKDSSLMFKITHKIAYKNVLKGTFLHLFL
jgi:dynamin 1/3